jgi:hypothetical protein
MSASMGKFPALLRVSGIFFRGTGNLIEGSSQNQPNLNTRGQKRKRLRILNAAAQTPIVSVAKIRLDPWKSVRPFKGIFCHDISEFESCRPRQVCTLI